MKIPYYFYIQCAALLFLAIRYLCVKLYRPKNTPLLPRFNNTPSKETSLRILAVNTKVQVTWVFHLLVDERYGLCIAGIPTNIFQHMICNALEYEHANNVGWLLLSG